MPSTLAPLTQNWMLKLAALALAILLWVVVSAEQVTSQWVTIPVRVADRDRAYTIAAGPAPHEVEVRFTGPGRELWELAWEHPVLVISVGEVAGESQSFALEPAMVRLPPGLTAVAAVEVRPNAARVRFRRVAPQPVAPVAADTPGPGRGRGR